MPSRNSDVERYKRLRDQQLASRDPLIKQRKLDHTIADKHRRSTRRFSFGEAWADIPHKWRDALVGALIGLTIMLLVPFLVEGIWGTCIGIGAFPLCAFVGLLVGRYEDAKEDVKDLLH